MNKEPDKLEKSIRFGCGSIFGFFIGLYIASRLLGVEGPEFPLTIILITLTCAYLAVIYGDKFWHFFIDK